MRQTSSVAIRRATSDDIGALRELESRPRDGEIQACWTQYADWPALFAEAGVFVYLAEDTMPFGVVAVGDPREHSYRDSKTGEVIVWYADLGPPHLGFDQKLLVHGLSVMKRRDFERAQIWLHESSAEAIESVRGLHFKQVGVKPLGDMNLVSFSLDLADYF